MSKIIKIFFFYRLKNYLKNQKKNFNKIKLYTNIINNFYYTKINHKKTTYLFRSENFINFILNLKNPKNFILRTIINKLFYLRVLN